MCERALPFLLGLMAGACLTLASIPPFLARAGFNDPLQFWKQRHLARADEVHYLTRVERAMPFGGLYFARLDDSPWDEPGLDGCPEGKWVELVGVDDLESLALYVTAKDAVLEGNNVRVFVRPTISEGGWCVAIALMLHDK